MDTELMAVRWSAMPPSRLLPIIAAMATLPVALYAQASPLKSSLSLDVRSVVSGATRGNAGSAYVAPNDRSRPMPGRTLTTSAFSRTRTAASGATLEVQVRNLSRAPEPVLVEWYFFSRPVNSRGNHPGKVHDHGSEQITALPMKPNTFEVSCRPIVRRTQEEVTTRMTQPLPGGYRSDIAVSRSRTGEKMYGWIVRLVNGENVLALKASQPSLESLGRELETLRKIAPAEAAATIR